MQETLTFPTLQEGSPPRFTFPELLPSYTEHHNFTHSACCSELSSSTSTPFVSAPSSPSRSVKAFCFSAPTSPPWPQSSLHPPEKQGFFDFPHVCPPHSSSPSDHDDLASFPLHTHHHGSASSVGGDSSSCSPNRSLRAEHTKSSSWSQKGLCHTQSREKTSSLSPQSLQTEHLESSGLAPQKSYQTEDERSPDWALHSPETGHHRSSTLPSHKPLQIHHGRSPSCSQQRPHQQGWETEHARNPLRSQHPQTINTDFANRKALKRLQVEDSDASYSRKSFYASAVPFSWEEKPGTPKARSIASEASNGEDDSPSNLLSGSSEFEFSARFELEDPPMSPTPISSPFNSFKNQYAHGSPCPNPNHINQAEQIWPLRPPPRLDTPASWKQPNKHEGNELNHSYGSQTPSLSTPQSPRSPRSPRISDLRGALCGILSPVDAVFDPFATAMEKSMAKSGDEMAAEDMEKSPKKKTSKFGRGHHRRTKSLSPLRVFHWDDHSVRSNSSSNGLTSMDEVKNKHPIHREIDARHSAGTAAAKGLKKWSFKGFLHRNSVSGGESMARHSNMSQASLRSSGRESCSSWGTAASGGGEGPMDASSVEDNVKIKGANSPSGVASMPSTPPSILSPSSSNNSSKGKLSTSRSNKGPYALHYNMQRAQTEELKKKTFLPYKQGLLGCLGLSSKSYRALASLSKPLQPVS